MKQIIQSGEIKNYIKDEDALLITDITLRGYVDGAAREVEKSFLKTGHPRDLTVYWTSLIGDRDTAGMAYLAHEGLLKGGVEGRLKGCGRNMVNLTASNKAEVFNFPQGITTTMARYISARKPDIITRIGLGTMVDPRMEGGAMNDRAKGAELQVELADVHSKGWLLYELPKTNVTLIRGNIADEKGSISIYREGYKLNQLSATSVAKACDDIVIVQVGRIVKIENITPEDVAAPGVMMDCIFCAKPENHWQTGKSYYNPSFSGELRVPLESVEKEALSARKVIVRKAAMLMCKGDVCNLGVGIPEAVSSIAAEEGVLGEVTLTTEVGNMGGMPANKHDFDCCWNPEATIEMVNNFNYYDGGCLDYGCLGILQIDVGGNVNASKLNGGEIGVGGFIGVATSSKTTVFTTIFVGGVGVGIEDGKLRVLKEGNVRKFLCNIEQISLNGELALKDDRQVYYVTERAVFRPMREGLELIEIAPRIDLQRDVLDQVGLEPIVRNVQMMPSELFNEQWGGLTESMEGNHQKKEG